MSKIVFTSGQQFGLLRVLEEVPSNRSGIRFIRCRCKCGSIKDYRSYNLRSGNSTGCGCEKLGARTHSMSGKPVYRVWDMMKQRCYNPKNAAYPRYGGRGIKMCREWYYDAASFVAWALANGHQKGLEIERRNNNRGYFPENCYFATYKEQANNRHNTPYVEVNGVRMRLCDAIQRFAKVKARTVGYRLKAGWPVWDALTKPLIVGNPHAVRAGTHVVRK